MQDSSASQARAGGIVLVVSSLLSAFVMAHHPSVHSPDMATALQAIKDLSSLSGWVHGILIALMLVTLWALSEFCRQRGFERPLVRAGLVFYSAGVFSMIVAAAVSGWISPAIAGFLPAPADQDLHTLSLLINFSGAVNRAMADIGAVAMSAGIFFWSLGLVHSAGSPRLVGAFGILVGALPALGLMASLFHLNVTGMLAVVLLQGLWTLAVGVLLITGRVTQGTGP